MIFIIHVKYAHGQPAELIEIGSIPFPDGYRFDRDVHQHAPQW